MGPKEDPAAKAARAQEKKIAGLEQDDANEGLARGMTSDFQSTYGNKFSLFNMLGRKP